MDFLIAYRFQTMFRKISRNLEYAEMGQKILF